MSSSLSCWGLVLDNFPYWSPNTEHACGGSILDVIWRVERTTGCWNDRVTWLKTFSRWCKRVVAPTSHCVLMLKLSLVEAYRLFSVEQWLGFILYLLAWVLCLKLSSGLLIYFSYSNLVNNYWEFLIDPL